MVNYPAALQLALEQLISNSHLHGFSDQPDPQIQIEVIADGPVITMIYTDNGAGILPDVQPKIFEPFFKSTRQSGCTGLHIAHSMVHQVMKGQISLQASRPGQTIFLIQIPSLS